MSAQNDLKILQNIIQNLDSNRVATFAYTQKAFDDDEIAGVDVFDKDAEQNIPKATLTGYNTTVLRKGVRSQGASIPRMGLNHFFGRLSFNVNKIIQKLSVFFSLYAAVWAHNAAEYDSAAQYRTGDICYYVETVRGVKVFTWFIRVSVSPNVISNIPPTTALHWAPMQNKTSLSALLPFSAPGYLRKYITVDLTSYPADKWYPVVTGSLMYAAASDTVKDGALQVVIEACVSGMSVGQVHPHRAEFSVISKFTGFADSSSDIVLNNTFVDETDGSVRGVSGSPIGFSKLVLGRQAVLWLRGGGRFAIWNSFGSSFTVHPAQYDNGADPVIAPVTAKPFEIYTGTVQARVKTPGAGADDEAPNRGQVSGALPLPKYLTAGASFRGIRTPGLYIAQDSSVANSILDGPVAGPGPFDLVVRGDSAGVATTTQQVTLRNTGEEYTRTLSGGIVTIPWYLSGSPEGSVFSGNGNVEALKFFSQKSLLITNAETVSRRLKRWDIGLPYLSPASEVYHFDTDFKNQNQGSSIILAYSADPVLVDGTVSNGQIHLSPAVLDLPPYEPLGKSILGRFMLSTKIPDTNATVEFWIRLKTVPNTCVFRLKGFMGEELVLVTGGTDPAYSTAANGDIAYTLAGDDIPYSVAAVTQNRVEHNSPKGKQTTNTGTIDANSWVHIAVIAAETQLSLLIGTGKIDFPKHFQKPADFDCILNEDRAEINLDELNIDRTVAITAAAFNQNTALFLPYGALDYTQKWGVLMFDNPNRIATNLFESEQFKMAVLSAIHNSR